jgi:hypothetical protein
LIGYTGDVGLFGNRDRFAAYDGTRAGRAVLPVSV